MASKKGTYHYTHHQIKPKDDGRKTEVKELHWNSLYVFLPDGMTKVASGKTGVYDLPQRGQ